MASAETKHIPAVACRRRGLDVFLGVVEKVMDLERRLGRMTGLMAMACGFQHRFCDQEIDVSEMAFEHAKVVSTPGSERMAMTANW